MVNIETHRTIDLLPSREVEDVVEWLKTYPNLEVVSRDGSVSYNSSIKQANENIIQISDRFHLIKGLTEAAKKYITCILDANIGLPVSESHYDGTQTKDYWEKTSHEDAATREHNANVEKKKKNIEKVLELTKQGKPRREIAEEVGISLSTVKRYQKPGFSPVHGVYNTKRKSKIKPFAEKINQMLSAGKTFREIEEEIRKDGYDGTGATIRMYATRERKLLKEAKKGQEGPVEKIERKWLISLLYKPIDKVKGISQEQLDKVIEKYPIIGEIYDTVKAFKETLFAKKPDELEKWLSEAEALKIDQIEGSVNKLKVVKRIMYGRNSFELLKGKLLRLELKRKVN